MSLVSDTAGTIWPTFQKIYEGFLDLLTSHLFSNNLSTFVFTGFLAERSLNMVQQHGTV